MSRSLKFTCLVVIMGILALTTCAVVALTVYIPQINQASTQLWDCYYESGGTMASCEAATPR